MKTLELFNAVVAKPTKTVKPVVSEDGFIIEPYAVWAKNNIVSFYKAQKLDGKELNKTFHKSWKKVRESSRYELALEQIRHYASTYGTKFQGEMYIPDETLDIPDLKLKFKVIKAYTTEEMTEKCLDLLRSGIALEEDTINKVLTVLTDELKYTFTGDEGIRNKEAIVKIADLYGVLPSDTMEFFRYVMYRATGDTLLIKNPAKIAAVKASNFNPGPHFTKHGEDKLATIFNRFKPLFLAFKKHCPATINRISKLSKIKHKPLVQNPLNMLTQRELTADDMHWLDNATPYALFKALQVCYNTTQSYFCYRIRNGKSWTKHNPRNGHSMRVIKRNMEHLLGYMATKYDMSGTKVFLPSDVEFALPTSEKMFVGNIPTGTRFTGEKMVAGIYWENSWGAHDLDLSAMDVGGNKTGWNARYSTNGLTYSGDITNAPNGAVEYLHAAKGLDTAQLIMNNVYSGQEDCEYKILVGKGSKVSKSFMMNPNKIMAEVKCQGVQRQMILGLMQPVGDKQTFVILNFGAGHAQVSRYGVTDSVKALVEQWSDSFTLNTLLEYLGAEIVESVDEADYDFSLDNLTKDSFTELFSV